MAVTVEVRDLSKVYPGGTKQAVDGVNLATEEGEYLVLLGPSGCGKTTLLRMIAGLEHPTGGDILIDGTVVNGLPPRVRGIAMVFQSYALYPHKTVMGNIVFPLRAAKMAKEEREAKARQAAEVLGLGGLLDRKPRQLSGGERQRVALARAMVRNPAVFLLDEPLSNLDAKLRATARDELKRFQERVGTTTIYVTHDQSEAMGLGDRIAVLDHGKVRQVGPPAEVYDNPADTFVATFIGSPPMNLITREDDLVGTAAGAHAAGTGSARRDRADRLRGRPHRVSLWRPARLRHGVEPRRGHPGDRAAPLHHHHTDRAGRGRQVRHQCRPAALLRQGHRPAHDGGSGGGSRCLSCASPTPPAAHPSPRCG